jgi:hypothetical protein
MGLIIALANMPDSNAQISFDLMALTMDPTCEPGSFQNGDYVLVIASDCSATWYQITPKGPQLIT